MSKIVGYINLSRGRRMELVKGDLTEEHVDVIVNAANQWLQHGTGVAGAIIQRGGSIIQKESNEWIAIHGSISRDQPAYTSAGSLPCKYVIHAVGPVWGEGEEEEKLYRAISGSLNLAIQLNAQTLSIPPISTGIFGFPKEKAAPIFYSAITNFWLSEPVCILTKIRITIIDDQTSKVFLTALEQWKKENHTDGNNG
jgi:O-acetyl-ADP-ribose deacetylase (regulator of RNase III)